MKIIETPEDVKQGFKKGMREYLKEYAEGYEKVVKNKVRNKDNIPLMYQFMDLKGEEIASPISVMTAHDYLKKKGIKPTFESVQPMIDSGVSYTVSQNNLITLLAFCMTIQEKDFWRYVLGLRTKDSTVYISQRYRKKEKKVKYTSCSRQALWISQGFDELGYLIHKDTPQELIK